MLDTYLCRLRDWKYGLQETPSRGLGVEQLARAPPEQQHVGVNRVEDVTYLIFRF